MEDKPDKKKLNVYVRLSSVVIQMGVVIGGFTWLGTYLDEKQQNETAIWTIVLALTGVMIGMYLIFKEVKNLNRDDKKN